MLTKRTGKNDRYIKVTVIWNAIHPNDSREFKQFGIKHNNMCILNIILYDLCNTEELFTTHILRLIQNIAYYNLK